MAGQQVTIDFGTGYLQASYLRQHFEDFARELEVIGHTRLTIQGYAGSIAHFGYWAQQQDIAITDWSRDTATDFARHRCQRPGRRKSPCVSKKYAKRVSRFIIYLEQQQVIRRAKFVTAPGPTPFYDWLRQHRGVCARTAERYEHDLLQLLADVDTGQLDALQVRSLSLKFAQTHSANHTRVATQAFRAFLRFLASTGGCPPGLDHAIPKIPQWRLAALPRYLSPPDVERVVASCSSDTSHGLRDRAILLLLARLGLRVGDIVALRLDEIDWRAGTLKVCGKGHQDVCLPLPQDAGDALLVYLEHGRSHVGIPQVFLCLQAPYRSLQSSNAVSYVVSSALRRAGICNAPTQGANLLRHSAATAMLRGGASPDVVSSIMRHRSLDMTGHYAKVDVAMLEHVVRAWPEAQSC